MSLGLRDHALARIHQHDREVRSGGPGDHVAGVLLVTGCVGDDEAALGRREVAVGHIDCDALLALGTQPVGEQREVQEVVTHALAGLLHVLQLIGQNLL